MTTKTIWLCGALLVAACGSKAKPADTTPDTTATTGDDAPPAHDDSANMFSPETMDQVTRALDRKRDSVARCLSVAVDNKELPKNARGHMTLEVVIGTGGSATSIKIIKSDLESKTLADCVQKKVQEISFPSVPKPYERSYMYSFEAD
jgi:hypothetical protein